MHITLLTMVKIQLVSNRMLAVGNLGVFGLQDYIMRKCPHCIGWVIKIILEDFPLFLVFAISKLQGWTFVMNVNQANAPVRHHPRQMLLPM